MTPQSPSFIVLFIFFIYGLAFFSLGMSLAVESGRFPTLSDARILRTLAIFGLLHGTHEWLDAYLMQAEAYGAFLPDWLPWFRLVLLISSFSFLIAYGIHVFHLHAAKLRVGRLLALIVLAVYIIFILVNAVIAVQTSEVGTFDLLNVLSRYLLAVPGAVLAGLALRIQAVQSTGEERPHLVTHLTTASIGFFVYGLAQVIVPKVNMFPADIINTASFTNWVGFPIQVIRAVMAVLITLGMIRVTQLAEKERQRINAIAQREYLEALEQRDNLRHELLFHTVQAQEEERTRIARELHDETSQILTAFSLDLATLQNTVKNDSKTSKMVARLQMLSKQMSQGLYRMVHDLRPAQLDDLGLIPAIQYLKDSMASQGVVISIEVEGLTRRLDSIVETVLFRVVQEALNNTLRHAKIQHAEIRVFFETDEIVVKVIDSGVGFNPDLPLSPPHGWGLAGMRERVDLIGGNLSIESAPGKGTKVMVTVPMLSQTTETNRPI
jgi:signal transduction histidine kinase